MQFINVAAILNNFNTLETVISNFNSLNNL